MKPKTKIAILLVSVLLSLIWSSLIVSPEVLAMLRMGRLKGHGIGIVHTSPHAALFEMQTGGRWQRAEAQMKTKLGLKKGQDEY